LAPFRGDHRAPVQHHPAALAYAAEAVSRNPATDALIARYPYHSTDEIEQLLQSGARACHGWRDTPMATRVAAYHRLAAVLRDRGEELAHLITAEMGKPIGAARGEVEKCAATLEWIADNGPAILADEPVVVEGAIRSMSPICPSARFWG
jgi:succinate-semialdehyde dehydrogenase